MVKVSKNLITSSGLKKLKDELKHLTTEVRKEISESIQRAKEFGDLSENAAYASAMEARDLNESRIAELEDIINNAKLVSADGNDDGGVYVGSKVTLITEKGETLTIELVGTGEGDPINHKVAADTPLAEAILGKKIKDKVSVELPSGKVVYEIAKIK